MKIHLIFVGKTREAYLREGIEDYLARLRHYVPVSPPDDDPFDLHSLPESVSGELMTRARLISVLVAAGLLIS